MRGHTFRYVFAGLCSNAVAQSYNPDMAPPDENAPRRPSGAFVGQVPLVGERNFAFSARTKYDSL